MAALPGFRALPDLYLEIVRRVREQRGNAEAARGDLLTAVMRITADETRQLAALAVDAEKVETGHRFRIRAVRGLALRSEGHRRDVKGSRVLARAGIRRTLGFIERPGEVDEVPQGNRVQCLELPQLLGVRRVRRLAVGDRERGLPSARPDPECRLEPGVATIARWAAAITRCGSSHARPSLRTPWSRTTTSCAPARTPRAAAAPSRARASRGCSSQSRSASRKTGGILASVVNRAITSSISHVPFWRARARKSSPRSPVHAGCPPRRSGVASSIHRRESCA